MESCPHCHREILRWKLLKVGVVVAFVLALVITYCCLHAGE
jgi:hypothetical protein